MKAHEPTDVAAHPNCSRRGSTVPNLHAACSYSYDEGLRFDVGDAAALYLTIPNADLRAGRFNRVDGEMEED